MNKYKNSVAVFCFYTSVWAFTLISAEMKIVTIVTFFVCITIAICYRNENFPFIASLFFKYFHHDLAECGWTACEGRLMYGNGICEHYGYGVFTGKRRRGNCNWDAEEKFCCSKPPAVGKLYTIWNVLFFTKKIRCLYRM